MGKLLARALGQLDTHTRSVSRGRKSYSLARVPTRQRSGKVPRMSRRMLHVRILGTHRLVRSYLHALLKDDKTIRVLQTDESAADRASSSRLVFVIDGGRCEKAPLTAVEDLKRRFPAAKMVVLSAAPPYADLVLLLSLGVTGVLT